MCYNIVTFSFQLHDGLAPVPEKKCHICGREFFLNDKYVRHVYKMHPDYWAAFSGGQPLEKFLPPQPPALPHTPILQPRQSCDIASSREKRYPCTLCDKRFSHETGLVKHMMTHPQGGDMNVQLFSCSVCQKVFTKESFLERHVDMKLDTEHTLLYAVMRRKSSEIHRLQLEAAKQVQKITLPRGYMGHLKDKRKDSFADHDGNSNTTNSSACNDSSMNSGHMANGNGNGNSIERKLPSHRDSTGDDVIIVNNESTLCLSTPSGEIIPSNGHGTGRLNAVERRHSSAGNSPINICVNQDIQNNNNTSGGSFHETSVGSTNPHFVNGFSLLADLDAAAAAASASSSVPFSVASRMDDDVHGMTSAVFTHRLMQQAVSSAIPPSEYEMMKQSYSPGSLMSSLTRTSAGGPPPLHLGPPVDSISRFNSHVDLPSYVDMNLLSPGAPYHHHNSGGPHHHMKPMPPRPGALQFPPLHDQLMNPQRIDQYQQNMELAGVLSSLAHAHAGH